MKRQRLCAVTAATLCAAVAGLGWASPAGAQVTNVKGKPTAQFLSPGGLAAYRAGEGGEDLVLGCLVLDSVISYLSSQEPMRL